MRRAGLNFVVDLVTFVAMAALIATGLLMRWVMPPGTGHRLSLWGMGHHDYGDVHFYLTLALGALLVLHIALHWTWVCSMTARLLRRPAQIETRRRHAYGIALIVLCVAAFAAFVWLADAQVRTVNDDDNVGRSTTEHGRASHLRDSTTVAELEHITGLPAERVLEELDPPTDVSPDQRLGPLARRHGLSMAELRLAIESLPLPKEDQP